MCGTTYQPEVPLEEQLEQLLHNISTWKDCIQLIEAQIPHTTTAKRVVHSRLRRVEMMLGQAHYEVVESFRALEAEKRLKTHA